MSVREVPSKRSSDSTADGGGLQATPPQMPLTVAHVIHSLAPGGAEAVLVELARAAASARLRVIVVGLSDTHTPTGVDRRVVPQLRDQGVTVHELHAGRYDIKAAFALAKLLRVEGVEIVHTHMKHADVVGGIAARLAGVPSVSTLHVIDVPTSRAHRLRVETAVLARRRLSSSVIALSDAQMRWYRQYAGADAPITLLPNGVTEPVVTGDTASVRAEVGVPRGAVLGLCVGLMRPEKGHACLLEAVRKLPADLPFVLGMAGDGPLLDDVRAAVAADSALAERVRILGFRHDVADLIAASDFVVQPSLEDALPTALISALAAARPIVATEVGGIPDIVLPGCGFLVEPGSAGALSEGISRMVGLIHGHSPTVDLMRSAARERYETRFSADVWVRSLRSVYEEAIGWHRAAENPPAPKSSGVDVGRRPHAVPRAANTETTTSGPIRIALVQFSPSGGLFQFSVQLGEALARGGDSVDLITGPSPELTAREQGCRVRSILPTWHPAAGGAVPEWWRRLRRGIRAAQYTAAWGILVAHLVRSRPDAVVWSDWQFPIDGWGVHLVRKALPDSVLALMAHEPCPLAEQPGNEGLYKTSGLTTRALTTAYADLDIAFVLGQSAKRMLEDSWPVTPPVCVISHPDNDLVASEDISDADTTAPVALSFGTITAYKGIDVLCQAWPTVRSQVPEAELIIAGAVGADVGRPRLTADLAALEGVEMHLDYVPMQEVPSYFERARCVVLPYKRSSQSGVAHLAHTLRRPVIASSVGDIPAVIRSEETGLLVPPSDPEALAKAIVRLLTEPQTARRMGEAGALALAAGSSWEKAATQVKHALANTARRMGQKHSPTWLQPG
jgi:glycosyltransferase involved in cell wall biosynthesis